jgi:REP element-mobilizing transposase RayT
MNKQSTHQRRSIRLNDYDYAQGGAYCVTVCTAERACLFGEVSAEGVMQLNGWGEVVTSCWEAIPAHFPKVELDAFVVMPNHMHGIVVINEDWKAGNVPVGARHALPLQRRPAQFGKPVSGSLGAIVGSFKSAATKRINEARGTPGAAVWQRNYYEQIVRDEKMLNALRMYVEANPANWANDEENPQRVNR